MDLRLIKKIVFASNLLGILLSNYNGYSQESTPNNLKFSGYVDAYYAAYSDSVGVNNFQKFPDVAPKSNQFGLNIFQITAQYTTDNVRAVGTFHYGDLPTAAWSADHNMIQEANAGVRLGKKVWIDAGYFKTHIGTEVLLPKDNIASSLSVITFYEPWWQSGMKISYNHSDKLSFALHILNGYNTYVENNKHKSLGLAVSYLLSDKGSISYYNLIGEEAPEGTATKHVRFLNNVVLNYQLTSKLKTNIGFDYISQQHSKLSDTTKTASVFSTIVTFRYQLRPMYAVYARGEMFSDKEGILTGQMMNSKGEWTGYILKGATLGIEYKPADNAFIRLEGRSIMMDANQQLFRTNGSFTNGRLEALINMGVTF